MDARALAASVAVRDAKAVARTDSAPAGRGCAGRRRRPGCAGRCRAACPFRYQPCVRHRVAAIVRHHLRGRGGRLDRLGQQRLDQRPLLLRDHVEQESGSDACRCPRPPGPAPAPRACDCRLSSRLGQGRALLGRIQQPLAPVLSRRPSARSSPVDQLLQHAGQALLGDLQDLEQVGDPQAGMAVDEMQHAVVGAAEPELGEHGVGLAREVAIGEEQQLDERDEMGIGARGAAICPRFDQRAPDACSASSEFMSAMLTYLAPIVSVWQDILRAGGRCSWPPGAAGA